MRNPKILVLDDTEDLSLQVRRVTAGLRPRPAVVWCAAFDLIDEVTDDVGPFDVLVAGPMVSKEAGFQNVRELRARVPETQVILALDHWRSTDLRPCAPAPSTFNMGQPLLACAPARRSVGPWAPDWRRRSWSARTTAPPPPARNAAVRPAPEAGVAAMVAVLAAVLCGLALLVAAGLSYRLDPDRALADLLGLSPSPPEVDDDGGRRADRRDRSGRGSGRPRGRQGGP